MDSSRICILTIVSSAMVSMLQNKLYCVVLTIYLPLSFSTATSNDAFLDFFGDVQRMREWEKEICMYGSDSPLQKPQLIGSVSKLCHRVILPNLNTT